MKREKVEVYVRGYVGKPIKVVGEKYGLLAVTPRIPGDTRGEHVITHIPSGFAVASTNSITKARKAAMELSLLNGWEGLRPSHKKKIAALAPLRREILERHGIL